MLVYLFLLFRWPIFFGDFNCFVLFVAFCTVFTLVRCIFDARARFLRTEQTSVIGRDQLSYRSYFTPVKVRTKFRILPAAYLARPLHLPHIMQDVIDGDLCEAFTALSYERQKVVAKGLDRTPGEVIKKLEDLRSRVL